MTTPPQRTPARLHAGAAGAAQHPHANSLVGLRQPAARLPAVLRLGRGHHLRGSLPPLNRTEVARAVPDGRRNGPPSSSDEGALARSLAGQGPLRCRHKGALGTGSSQQDRDQAARRRMCFKTEALT
jgi:hypothetical protein